MLTKDFTVPLSKDDFKTALEAYSIGMPTSPSTELQCLKTICRVPCRGLKLSNALTTFWQSLLQLLDKGMLVCALC